MNRDRGAWLRALGWAVLALGLGVLPSVARARPADVWTTVEVKAELLLEEGMDALDIDTTDGVVTLHGVVDSDESRARADSIARGLGGTRSVRNLLQVVPAESRAFVARSDDELREEVEAALEADRGLAGVDVAAVHEGVVVLEGRVPSVEAHLSAVERAEGVHGVQSVSSELRSPERAADAELWRDSGALDRAVSEPVRDTWLTGAAKLHLALLRRADVQVHSRGGYITLFGLVEDDAECAATADAVARTPWVRGIRNELQVVPARERAAVERRDASIEPSVEQRLASERELENAALDVEVSNGVVWLEGDVEDRAARRSALILARTTEGVRAVLPALEIERE